MSARKSLLALIATLFAASPLLASGNPPSRRGNLIHSNSPFTRVGGDKVIFGLSLANGCDEGSLKAAAINLKNNSTTDRWDDLWYAFSVPRGRCFMIGWYDLTAGKYGYAAVQNMPNTWGVRSNSRGWETIGNGVQKKYSFKINGQGVDLDIFNPQNQDGLDGNDILVSFGF